MKRILTIIALIILCASVEAYTLIDSDNFESYTTWTVHNTTAEANWIVNETGTKWNCSTAVSNYPSCRALTGSGTGKDAGYAIQQTGINKWLWIYALNGTLSDYYRTDLTWNHSAVVVPDGNITFAMDMRLIQYSTLTGGALVTGLSGAYFETMPATYTTMGTFMGGVPSTNSTNYTSVRSEYQSGVATHPQSSTCTMDDGNWHYLVAYYSFNSTCDLQNVTMYKDGALCYVYPVGKLYNCGDNMISADITRFVTFRAFSIGIDNISFFNGTAPLTPTPATQCDDAIDNDGDGLIDYGGDPSCTSFADDSESPFDYVQCNNGIDDDGDTYTDYPDDPSCSSAGDSTESPKDATTQTTIPCLVQNRCVLKDTFPYTDNITLHGWYGDVSTLAVWTSISPYKLLHIYTDNFYNATLNATNPNIYDKVDLDFQVWVSPYSVGALPPESFYLKFLDNQDREVIKLRFDLQNTGITPYMNWSVNNVQTFPVGNVSNLWYFIPCASGSCTTATPKCVFDTTIFGFDIGFICHTDKSTAYPEYSYATFQISADQTLKEYDLTFTDWNSQTYHYNAQLPFSNIMSSKIEKVVIENINLTDNWHVFIGGLGVHGDISEFETVCDEYTLPYYLKESFNGYPASCGWVVSDNNVFFTGQFAIDQTTPRYYIQKTFDTITEESQRYTTVKWDMNLQNLTGSGSFVLRLYDTDETNYFSAYILDNAPTLFYNQHGTSQIATNISLNTWNQFTLIIDSQSDTFDLYVNGTSVVSDGGFTTQFYNLHDWATMKIDTGYLGIIIDNVQIYSSDGTASPLMPNTPLTPEIDNDTSWCGLFSKTEYTCATDADCASGDCLPNHKCNHFDMTYCDENGYVRGNKCLLAGMSKCFFQNTADVVTDNFLWVIIFILLIMGLVYVSILFRRRG